MEEKGPKPIRALPYFISHFAILIVAVLTLVLVYVCYTSKSVGPYTSATASTPFSNSMEPGFFVQLSDVHSQELMTSRTAHNIAMFKNVSDIYNPPVVVITGDLVDGSNGTSEITWYDKFIENWQVYNRTRYESGMINSSRVVIEGCGNHDLFGVLKDTSESNYYRRYVLNSSESFEIRSDLYYITGQSLPVKIITMNALRPPFSAGTTGLMPYVDADILNGLEAQITSGSVNVLSNHFPVSMLWGSKSKTGKSIRDLVETVPLVITGHTHPTKVELARYSSALTAICPATKVSNYFGIVTIDNSVIAYHQMDSTLSTDLVVTFPIPKSQLTSNSIFNLHSMPIRVLQFGSTSGVTATIDGSTTYSLDFVSNIRSGVRFFSKTVSVSNGTHTLSVSDGSTVRTVEFFVGETLQKTTETFTGFEFMGDPSSLVIFYVVSAVWVLLRLIPWWIPLSERFDRFEEFLYGQSDECKVGEYFYIGIPYFAARVRRAPNILYIVLWILALWYFPAPFYLTKVEAQSSEAWIWSIVTGKDVQVDATMFGVSAFYLFFYVLSLVSMAGLWWEVKKFSVIHWIEFGLLCLPVLIFVIVWFVGSFSIYPTYCLFTSPLTYIILIGIAICAWQMATGKAKIGSIMEGMIEP